MYLYKQNRPSPRHEDRVCHLLSHRLFNYFCFMKINRFRHIWVVNLACPRVRLNRRNLPMLFHKFTYPHLRPSYIHLLIYLLKSNIQSKPRPHAYLLLLPLRVKKMICLLETICLRRLVLLLTNRILKLVKNLGLGGFFLK